MKLNSEKTQKKNALWVLVEGKITFFPSLFVVYCFHFYLHNFPSSLRLLYFVFTVLTFAQFFAATFLYKQPNDHLPDGFN